MVSAFGADRTVSRLNLAMKRSTQIKNGRGVRWAGHVACIGEKRICVEGFGWKTWA